MLFSLIVLDFVDWSFSPVVVHATKGIATTYGECFQMVPWVGPLTYTINANINNPNCSTTDNYFILLIIMPLKLFENDVQIHQGQGNFLFFPNLIWCWFPWCKWFIILFLSADIGEKSMWMFQYMWINISREWFRGKGVSFSWEKHAWAFGWENPTRAWPPKCNNC